MNNAHSDALQPPPCIMTGMIGTCFVLAYFSSCVYTLDLSHNGQSERQIIVHFTSLQFSES
eukprot:SAG31_NODE_6506_length_1992_cov_2.123085_3_plen_61_part_00